MSLDEALPCTVLVCGVTIALLLFLLHLLTRHSNPPTMESRSISSSHSDLVSTSGIPWPSSQRRTEQVACFKLSHLQAKMVTFWPNVHHHNTR